MRNDLRLEDNPALDAAGKAGLPVIILYVLEDGPDEYRLQGGARNWWLNKSLQSLDEQLKAQSGTLNLRRCNGRDIATVFDDILTGVDVANVFWNRRYAPHDTEKDKRLKAHLTEKGIQVTSFNGSLLMEPWQVQTQQGGQYKVFTPFWKALKPDYVRTHPSGVAQLTLTKILSDDIASWKLHPEKPDWSGGLEESWTPGASGARERLSVFLDEQLMGYKDNRDRPDKPATSFLSPYLAFGEISPQAVWETTRLHMDAHPEKEGDGWAFLRELAWRDFSYSLLFQADQLHRKNWNNRFDEFPWTVNEACLTAWQKGQTGYPIVDAGMRQLWQTGWMHNRVRMIVGSFLVKHLLLDWREGEAWFWDTLVDADWANNPASWQWIAGSGADAAPYFRIFNPMTQGEKFDPDGDYVRKWVPELSNLENRYLHQPWTAPAMVLKCAGIKLGKTYPEPIVDHKSARERALEAYGSTK